MIDLFVVWCVQKDADGSLLDAEACVFTLRETAEEHAREWAQEFGGEFFIAPIHADRVARVTVEDAE